LDCGARERNPDTQTGQSVHHRANKFIAKDQKSEYGSGIPKKWVREENEESKKGPWLDGKPLSRKIVPDKIKGGKGKNDEKSTPGQAPQYIRSCNGVNASLVTAWGRRGGEL